MTRRLSDLHDVQGLVRGYGSHKFPVGRFYFVRYEDGDDGRALLQALLDGISTVGTTPDPTSTADDPGSGYAETLPAEELAVANALQWTTPPAARLNVALTFPGLKRLQVPWEVLDSFPKEFKIGMRNRATVLGDDGDSDPANWDAIWHGPTVHMWIGVYARDTKVLSEAGSRLEALIDATGCQSLAHEDVGHLQPNGKLPEIPIEHFGFQDGISGPPIAGLHRNGRYAGGRLGDNGGWAPMAAGEFLLGPYQDEIEERPRAPNSDILATNGTFMVYRKLYQDVNGFRQYVHDRAAQFGADDEYVAAKMVGRYRDGRPLMPVNGGGNNDFLYGDDPEGSRCPLGSHIRRANPRDTFGYGTRLVNRHRMLRRGIPYGRYVPESEAAESVNGEAGQGLIFIALNASIERQFEFVQQLWINYGDVFFQGSDRDPVAGSHPYYMDKEGNERPYGQFRYWNDSKGRLNVCQTIPRFVTTRGGDYFFMPGIRALTYLATDRYVRARPAVDRVVVVSEPDRT